METYSVDARERKIQKVNKRKIHWRLGINVQWVDFGKLSKIDIILFPPIAGSPTLPLLWWRLDPALAQWLPAWWHRTRSVLLQTARQKYVQGPHCVRFAHFVSFCFRVGSPGTLHTQWERLPLWPPSRQTASRQLPNEASLIPIFWIVIGWGEGDVE